MSGKKRVARCAGCIHWWEITFHGPMCCHYLLDTGERRGSRPEDCGRKTAAATRSGAAPRPSSAAAL